MGECLLGMCEALGLIFNTEKELFLENLCSPKDVTHTANSYSGKWGGEQRSFSSKHRFFLLLYIGRLIRNSRPEPSACVARWCPVVSKWMHMPKHPWFLNIGCLSPETLHQCSVCERAGISHESTNKVCSKTLRKLWNFRCLSVHVPFMLRAVLSGLIVIIKLKKNKGIDWKVALWQNLAPCVQPFALKYARDCSMSSAERQERATSLSHYNPWGEVVPGWTSQKAPVSVEGHWASCLPSVHYTSISSI